MRCEQPVDIMLRVTQLVVILGFVSEALAGNMILSTTCFVEYGTFGLVVWCELNTNTLVANEIIA